MSNNPNQINKGNNSIWTDPRTGNLNTVQRGDSALPHIHTAYDINGNIIHQDWTFSNGTKLPMGNSPFSIPNSIFGK